MKETDSSWSKFSVAENPFPRGPCILIRKQPGSYTGFMESYAVKRMCSPLKGCYMLVPQSPATPGG